MTELRVLYIVLSLAVASLAIFGSVALYKLYKVLGDLDKTLGKVDKTADLIEDSVSKIVPIVNGFSGAVTLLVGLAQKWLDRKSVGDTKS